MDPEKDLEPTKLETSICPSKATTKNLSNLDHPTVKTPHYKNPPAVSSSVKRSFSDLERSPEPLEAQAKKRNGEYKRCYDIPEESTRLHTGLTGTFSSIQIGHFMASTEKIPNPSSSIAKTLFCDLEEPAEEVLEDGAKDFSHSSFMSPLAENSDLYRGLDLDSDGSMHETSLTVSPKQDKCSVSDSSITVSPSQTESSKLGNLGVRGESQCSLVNHLPDVACSAAQSPSFLKPRSVVAFRSYCSSINRSNLSGVSRLSIGAMEAMDVSTSASYYSAHGAATPVQKTSHFNSSLLQVDDDALYCTSYYFYT